MYKGILSTVLRSPMAWNYSNDADHAAIYVSSKLHFITLQKEIPFMYSQYYYLSHYRSSTYKLDGKHNSKIPYWSWEQR